ncbi:MAG: glycosyltransferase family 2 protein [Deltaproteobacteria bacterium]|nr:glycosyltransferase family 2 protein [Deltaproteobacteria bacterium]MBW2363205.1 glycosyltransferase family 2 protein [Deltaproteobacteria bacterium]
MKVSILITTYRQAQTVLDAVESALAQDHPDLEVVVSDDASDDETQELLVRHAGDPRLRVRRNEHNLGRVANYRRLLNDLATGDWALALDGDDYLVNRGYVSNAMKLVTNHPELVLVFGRIQKRAENTNVLREPLKNRSLTGGVFNGNDLFLRLPLGEVGFYHNACIFDRREAIRHDFYRSEIVSSDWESLHRLILGRQVGFVDEVASVWRRNSSGVTMQACMADHCDNLEAITAPYERAKSLAQIGAPELDGWLRSMLYQEGHRVLKRVRGASPSDILGYLREIGRLRPTSAARLAVDPVVVYSLLRAVFSPSNRSPGAASSEALPN